MKASPQVIGVLAGLVAAVLFVSLTTNTLLALALFYLTPLPVLLTGIGWGVAAAQLALVVATVTIGVAGGIELALIYALCVGVPSLIFSYLVLLCRQRPSDDPEGAPVVEWYPPGRIIAWASVMAGLIVAGGIAQFGDFAHYRQSVKDLFNPAAAKLMQEFFGSTPDAAQIERFIDGLANFALPASVAISWLAVMLVNIWLAAKSASISGQLPRPWPSLLNIEYPPLFVAVFPAAIGVSFASGLLGVMAMAFVGAFAFAHMVMGLAVLHVLVAGVRLKFLLLGAIYFGILRIAWVAPAITILGLSEPFLELRRRVSRQSVPPNS